MPSSRWTGSSCNKKNVMNRFIERALFTAVVVAALVWGVRELRLRQSAPSSNIPHQEAAETTTRTGDLSGATHAEDDGASPREEPAADRRDDDTVPSLVGKSIHVEQEPPDDFLERISDPKRKNFLRASLVAAMDPVYAPLFRCYQMSPEQLAYIKHLLAEKKVVENEYNLRAIRSSPEGRPAVMAEGKSRTDEWETKIKTFLGPDAYDLYEGYNRSLPERMVVRNYKTRLETEGLGLSYEQEDSLIRTMYEERRNSIEMRDFYGSDNAVFVLERTRGRSEIILRDYKAMTERIAIRCQSAIPPTHYAAFTNQLAFNGTAMEGVLAILSTLNDEDLGLIISGGF